MALDTKYSSSSIRESLNDLFENPDDEKTTSNSMSMSMSSQSLQSLPTLSLKGGTTSNTQTSIKTTLSSLIEEDDIKQLTAETHLHRIDSSNSNTHSNCTSPTASPAAIAPMASKQLSIIYDDKNWRKFKQIYKVSKTKKNLRKKLNVTLIELNQTNNDDTEHKLCYKETTCASSDELDRCIAEYKTVDIFYNALNLYHSTNRNQITEETADTEETSSATLSNLSALYIQRKMKTFPKKVRLVMKYHCGEDLDDFLVDEDDGEVGFLYENDFRVIMKKILAQLAVLHRHRIIHCDLKPSNIRINEQSDKFEEDDPQYYDVNIIDFGYSHILSANKKVMHLPYIQGSTGYIPPEVIKNKKYSEKSDIFSLGCVAFFLLTNNYAVLQSPDMDLEHMMPDRKRLKRLLKRENDRNRDQKSKIHQKTIDFVLQCLWRNPAKRPTAEEALKFDIFQ